ncbi:MAG TPA: sialidase family protein, partial [Kofleriaceae bacterium]|nr:sialidase family protein [Kofleriaceae bacterium]
TLTLGAGCSINDYCIGCELGGGDGGIGSGDGGGSGSSDGGMTCDPMQVHPEMCNHADDDCDGNIDETFDLQTDLNNCGTCGNKCNKAGAQTTCGSGACAITGCFPGFFDKNGDITGPYAMSDGCEYMCFQTNGGFEACDGVDNDCDGNTDETFDLTNDVDNCGQCNKVCQFFQATPHCGNSVCSFDPTTDCAAGYIDIDGQQANGCEYQCTPTGAEVCDLRDNNCNGSVDETFDLTSDVNNCGGCGFVCQFPHATPHCMLMTCGFNPATDCQAGFVDVDGNQLNGCEYQCSKTNGGTEICDGIDNDCDGIADDSPVDAGAACSATSPPMGQCAANGTLSCSNGSLVCINATQPVVETCNNLDDDCNNTIDNGVTQSCYTGPMNTSGVGLCHNGTATCAAGVFGACMGQVVPVAELCNNLDDNCNGMIDDGPGGQAITQSCYTGPMGTSGVGLCHDGTRTCAFGAFGACVGQVTPITDICGDGLDSDCDGQNDAQEGCIVVNAEQRLDGGGNAGALGTAAAARHDYDLAFARGGNPLGSRVYAAWSHLEGTVTEVYFRRSLDGGSTWDPIINVTSGVSATAVKPIIAVSPGASDRVVIAYQTVNSGVRDIVVSVSADSGGTFGAASAALDAAGDSFHQSVAVRGTTVVVAWEKLDTTTLDRDIQSRASTDGGATWGTERKINVGSPANGRFAGRPQVGLTSAGAAIWAWREKRSNTTLDIFAAVSANPNNAPAADIRVDTDPASNDDDFPQLVVEETSAYLVWQEVSGVTNGGSDVMFARSTNGGTSWSAERIIDDPVTEVSSSFTPVLAVDPKAAGGADDLVAIAWEDRRQGTQVYTSTSTNGGAAFGTPVRASNNAGAPISGTTSAPQIASAGSGVLVVVYQNKQGQNPSHVFTASSIDSGATWSYTHVPLDTGAGSAITPQVVGSIVANKPAAVAGWTDFRTNGVNGDIYTALAHR